MPSALSARHRTIVAPAERNVHARLGLDIFTEFLSGVSVLYNRHWEESDPCGHLEGTTADTIGLSVQAKTYWVRGNFSCGTHYPPTQNVPSDRAGVVPGRRKGCQRGEVEGSSRSLGRLALSHAWIIHTCRRQQLRGVCTGAARGMPLLSCISTSMVKVSSTSASAGQIPRMPSISL